MNEWNEEIACTNYKIAKMIPHLYMLDFIVVQNKSKITLEKVISFTEQKKIKRKFTCTLLK